MLLALALLAGGVLLVVESALVALGRPALLVDRQGWHSTLSTSRLNSPVVLTVSILIALFGLLILIGQVRRWTPDRVPTPFGDGWHLQRRSVERRLAAAVDALPGVSVASARFRRHGSDWRARIRAIGDPTARPAVENAVRQELDRLAAPPPQQVGIDLIPGRKTR